MFTKDKRARERYPGEAEDTEALENDLRLRAPTEQIAIRKTIDRYETEAEKRLYRADASTLAEFMISQKLLEGSAMLVDLGCGPGDLAKYLAENYLPTSKKPLGLGGVDLPAAYGESFQEIEAGIRMSERVVGGDRVPFFGAAGYRRGLIDSPNIIETLAGPEDVSVVSILTLDRVADPLQLIKNMGKFEKARILATLLPVVPEDDNPSRQEKKIVYTPADNRVTPGQSRSEDLQSLKTLLTKEWKAPVEIAQVPYAVESAGDRQEYMLDVFFTRPKQ